MAKQATARSENGGITAEQIAELKQRHGKRLYLIDDEEVGPIVFKPAAQETWDEFVDSVADGISSGPTRVLFDACVVYPSVEECQRIHAEFPALADSVASAIKDKSGGRKGLEAKKL